MQNASSDGAEIAVYSAPGLPAFDLKLKWYAPSNEYVCSDKTFNDNDNGWLSNLVIFVMDMGKPFAQNKKLNIIWNWHTYQVLLMYY